MAAEPEPGHPEACPPAEEETGLADAGRPMSYDLADPLTFFWVGQPMRIGNIIEVDCQRQDGSPEEEGGLLALLVKSWNKDEAGLWCEVKILGGHPEWAWQEGVRIFSRKKLRVHLCHFEDGICPLHAEPGLHVTVFRVYEPGVLTLAYVDRKRRKEWESALTELGFQQEEPEFPPEPPLGGGGLSAGEKADDVDPEVARQRIGQLRARLFEARPSGGARLGPGRQDLPPALGFNAAGQVKREDSHKRVKTHSTVVAISDEEEVKPKRSSMVKAHSRSIGTALKQAVVQRARLVEEQRKEEKLKKKKKRKKTRGRSRSRKKRRRGQSTTSSMMSGSSSSSSTDRHLPPLQRRAAKKPGSVLALLLDHIAESLSQAALEDQDATSSGLGTSSSKTMTYFQIMVRPQIPAKMRDLRELETLARAIDSLRAGKVEQLGDLLSGRFIALENAALTGSWQTAQWLEVAPARVPGLAQTPLLLEVQRHGKVVERASGRGSWPRSKNDSWGTYGRQTGEDASTRGKGKGGKSKGKNKKGKKSSWTDKPPAEAAQEATT